MDDLIRRFAEAGHVLPVAAMREAVARWDEAAPLLLAQLEAYADGTDRSETAVEAVFFIIYLVAQQQEARAFPALCRLARDAEAMEVAIGDGITEDLAGILARTFDGSLETLAGLADAVETDDFIRGAAIGALTLLTAQGRIPATTTEAVLRDLHDRWVARDDPDEWIWVSWQQAVALLGLDSLRPIVDEVFRTGRIEPSIMELGHFETDLREGLATATAEDRLALLAKHSWRLVEDAEALLSGFHWFTEEGRREAGRRTAHEALGGAAGWGGGVPFLEGPRQPVINPHRHVGRNDPCPCGSGKKFKKCCLAA